MGWRTAGGVLVWHTQLKVTYPRAAPPATAASSWGTVGDLAHSSTSDHYPKDFPGWGSDIVTAGDAPHAPNLGLDMFKVTEAMRVSRDERIKYVIFYDRMFSSYSTSSRAAWAWGPYSGSDDPHRTHAHLSVVGDRRADGTQPWSIGGPVALTPDELAILNQIKADCAAMILGSVNNRNAQIHHIRNIIEGTAWTSPLGTGKPGIPQILDAIEELPTGLAQQIAIELAGNPAFVTGLADAIAAAVGAKIGGVLADIINGSEVTSTIHTADQ